MLLEGPAAAAAGVAVAMGYVMGGVCYQRAPPQQPLQQQLCREYRRLCALGNGELALCFLRVTDFL